METSKRKRMGLILSIAMVVTMVMGPGPGLRLVNPDINQAGETFTIAGLPVIYVWGLFWFAIQVLIVITAYFTVWNEPAEVSE